MRRLPVPALAAVLLVVVAGGLFADRRGLASGQGTAQANHVSVVRASVARHVAVAAGTRRLSCRLRTRRYRTLPDVRPPPFCVAIRRGAKVAGEASSSPRDPIPSATRTSSSG